MTIRSTPVGVPAYNTRLLGNLSAPDRPTALAVVAYTSASARGTPPEHQLVAALRDFKLATLRLDLLTSDEAALHAIGRRSRHDIGVLGKRLAAAMEWVSAQAQFAGLSRAFIGTGLGATAAFAAAADRPEIPQAIISIDGWTEHLSGTLENVRAPTLLIAGRNNTDIVALNESALARLRSLKHLELIGGVTNILENHDALDAAARLTADWLQRFLRLPSPSDTTR